MPIKLTDLVERVPADVEDRVKRVRDRSRSVLQEALRAECRLVMRPHTETENREPGAQVQVEILPGHPAVLNNIEFSDELERILLLGRYRASLEQTVSGVRGLIGLRKELFERSDGAKWAPVKESDLQAVLSWADSLLRDLKAHDPVKTVLAIQEDFLGVYQYQIGTLFEDEYAANRASIRLYWGVIGLVAELMGVSVEDLAVVVLTHELAHAYTQLGADIEGRRWPAQCFAQAESALKEGLAQYYTDRVLRRLESRFAGALKVYEQLLQGQPDAYRTHLPWLDGHSPEPVRLAMLEVRRWREKTLKSFNERLAKAEATLNAARGEG